MVDVALNIEVDRFLPDAEPEGAERPWRAHRYGEGMNVQLGVSDHWLSDEGSFFTACNPTPGTAFSDSIKTAFSDTVPMIYLANLENPGNPRAKSIYLEYIKLIVSVAAASGTNAQFAGILDAVPRAFGTDNTTVISPVSTSSNTTVSALSMLIKAQSSATASVLAASSQQKRVATRGSFPSGITIVGDELEVLFGLPSVAGTAGLTAAQAVMPARKVTHGAPIIIGPGASFAFHTWFPGNAVTPLSYEFEIGGWLR